MLRATVKKGQKPATIRVLSLLLAVVAFCFCIILATNALRGSKTSGFQMLIITSLAESVFDSIAHYYDRYDDR